MQDHRSIAGSNHSATYKEPYNEGEHANSSNQF